MTWTRSSKSYLTVRPRFLPIVREGRKKSITRLGRLDMTVGSGLVLYGGDEELAVHLTKVTRKLVKELTKEDAQLDGSKTREEMIDDLKEQYPFLSEDDEVTVIEFRLHLS